MDKIKQAKEEYLKKFFADVEKLKAEKEGEQPAEVEIYCIDSQGNKRTLEEIHSVFSGSISYKAENERRKKLGIKSNP